MFSVYERVISRLTERFFVGLVLQNLENMVFESQKEQQFAHAFPLLSMWRAEGAEPTMMLIEIHFKVFFISMLYDMRYLIFICLLK